MALCKISDLSVPADYLGSSLYSYLLNVLNLYATYLTIKQLLLPPDGFLFFQAKDILFASHCLACRKGCSLTSVPNSRFLRGLLGTLLDLRLPVCSILLHIPFFSFKATWWSLNHSSQGKLDFYFPCAIPFLK